MNYSRAIVDAILELQRKNRNISPQELTANIILILLSHHTEINLSGLIEFLNCPQSYLTHFIKRLLKNKLIKMRQDSQDLRFRYYSLTSAGKAAVSSLDKRYDSILLTQEKSLTQAETTALAIFFRRLSDSAGIVPQQRRSHEHIIRPEQRRLAALLGVSGRTLFGLKVSPSTFHVLQLIFIYNGLLTTKDLAEILNLNSAQISVTLKTFSDHASIVYFNNPYDDRSKLISLTNKGVRYYKDISNKLCQIVEHHLASFSSTDLQNFVELCTRFVKTSKNIIEIHGASRSCSRARILEFCYLNRSLESVPERIASSADQLYGIEYEGEVICYAQVKTEENIVNLVAWKPNTSLWIVHNLLFEVTQLTKASLASSSKLLNLFAKSLDYKFESD